MFMKISTLTSQRKQNVWTDFDARARAADGRMWPAWYYASGIVPLASARMLLNDLNARAKVAREAPFDRNVEKPLVKKIVSESAREQIF